MNDTRLDPFAYRVWSEFSPNLPKFKEQQEQHWLLAVSGGLDSVVLWELVNLWSRRHPIKVSVAHVHHGEEGASAATLEFRRRSYEWVQQRAQTLGQNIYHNYQLPTPISLQGQKLNNEEGWRELRQSWFQQWLAESGAEHLVLGHHRDDLLETRLIRLIRGCSGDGLVAMKPSEENRLRPLLSCRRQELEEYAAQRGLIFLEDPSNEDTRFLRNWLRRSWLPALEDHRPGAGLALTRSLESVAAQLEGESVSGSLLEEWLTGAAGGVEMKLSRFLGLSVEQQDQSIALLFQKVGCQGFTRGQILEVRKRLLSRQVEGHFLVGGCSWSVNAEQITVQLRS